MPRAETFIRRPIKSLVTVSAVSALVVVGLGLATGDAPKPSAAASAADLAAAAEEIVKGFDAKLGDEDAARKGYVLALIANALPDAEGQAKWKSNALAVRDAAILLAKGAKSQATVDKQVKAIKGLLEGGKGSDGKPMKFLEVAPLEQVMKEVNDRNRPMTKNFRGFARTKEQIARDAQVFALLAAVARTDTKSAEKAKKPQADFEKYADEFFNSSVSLAAAAKKGDQAAANEAYKAVKQACSSCHAVFRPDIE